MYMYLCRIYFKLENADTCLPKLDLLNIIKASGWPFYYYLTNIHYYPHTNNSDGKKMDFIKHEELKIFFYLTNYNTFIFLNPSSLFISLSVRGIREGGRLWTNKLCLQIWQVKCSKFVWAGKMSLFKL